MAIMGDPSLKLNYYGAPVIVETKNQMLQIIKDVQNNDGFESMIYYYLGLDISSDEQLINNNENNKVTPKSEIYANSLVYYDGYKWRTIDNVKLTDDIVNNARAGVPADAKKVEELFKNIKNQIGQVPNNINLQDEINELNNKVGEVPVSTNLQEEINNIFKATYFKPAQINPEDGTIQNFNQGDLDQISEAGLWELYENHAQNSTDAIDPYQFYYSSSIAGLNDFNNDFWVEGKNIYYIQGTPNGNPQEQKFYEYKDNQYELTTDTEVNFDKKYYFQVSGNSYKYLTDSVKNSVPQRAYVRYLLQIQYNKQTAIQILFGHTGKIWIRRKNSGKWGTQWYESTDSMNNSFINKGTLATNTDFNNILDTNASYLISGNYEYQNTPFESNVKFNGLFIVAKYTGASYIQILICSLQHSNTVGGLYVRVGIEQVDHSIKWNAWSGGIDDSFIKNNATITNEKLKEILWQNQNAALEVSAENLDTIWYYSTLFDLPLNQWFYEKGQILQKWLPKTFCFNLQQDKGYIICKIKDLNTNSTIYHIPKWEIRSWDEDERYIGYVSDNLANLTNKTSAIIIWKQITCNSSEQNSNNIANNQDDNIAFELYTDLEYIHDGWWTSNGGHRNPTSSGGYRSQLLPIRGGQTYYSGWGYSETMNRQYGAFFDKNKNFIKTVNVDVTQLTTQPKKQRLDLTKDTYVKKEKTYYKWINGKYEPVLVPQTAYLKDYYEKINNCYILTDDKELIFLKSYYKKLTTGEYVKIDQIDLNLSELLNNEYYECKEGYVKTSDKTLNLNKTYYRWRGNYQKIDLPQLSNLPIYYNSTTAIDENDSSKTDTIYTITTDTEIDQNKSYYIRCYTIENNPSNEYLSHYYELWTNWKTVPEDDTISELRPVQADYDGRFPKLGTDQYYVPNGIASGAYYVPLLKMKAPDNAAYFSLNLLPGIKYKTRNFVSSLPIFALSGIGNFVVKKDDPLYQKKKNKKLCIIGPSTLVIDQSRKVDVVDQSSNTFRTQTIVGNVKSIDLNSHITFLHKKWYNTDRLFTTINNIEEYSSQKDYPAFSLVFILNNNSYYYNIIKKDANNFDDPTDIGSNTWKKIDSTTSQSLYYLIQQFNNEAITTNSLFINFLVRQYFVLENAIKEYSDFFNNFKITVTKLTGSPKPGDWFKWNYIYISGFAQYLAPWYKEVRQFGYSGQRTASHKGFTYDGANRPSRGIYDYLIDNNNLYKTFNLADYDEFIITYNTQLSVLATSYGSKYDPSHVYAKNEYVWTNHKLYQAIKTTTGVFNMSDWQTCEYDVHKKYSVGDLFEYNGYLYQVQVAPPVSTDPNENVNNFHFSTTSGTPGQNLLDLAIAVNEDGDLIIPELNQSDDINDLDGETPININDNEASEQTNNNSTNINTKTIKPFDYNAEYNKGDYVIYYNHLRQAKGRQVVKNSQNETVSLTEINRYGQNIDIQNNQSIEINKFKTEIDETLPTTQGQFVTAEWKTYYNNYFLPVSPMGDYTSTDEKTFIGALHKIILEIKKLKGVNNYVPIYLVTSLYKSATAEYYYSQIEALAEELKIQLITRGADYRTTNWPEFSYDGVHSNNLGSQLAGFEYRKQLLGF